MQQLKIGIAGLGTVAQGLLTIASNNGKLDNDKLNNDKLNIVAVSSRTAKPELDLNGASFSNDVFSLIDNPEVAVVVELIGGIDTAKQLIEKALTAKKSVVTANKALIAKCGTHLKQLAKDNGVNLYYEASVAGSIPILQTLKQYHLNTGVSYISGIINGSCNYILSQMFDDDKNFKAALTEAQELGYAEADPKMDIEGIDSSQKLAILASLCFGIKIEDTKIECTGITDISNIDINYAKELGYTIKHLATAYTNDNKVYAVVEPTFIGKNNILSNVNQAMNGIFVRDSYNCEYFYYGQGAGSIPTATAVYNDLISHSDHLSKPIAANTNNLESARGGLNSSQYYIRVLVSNNPGIISKVSSKLAELEVNIEILLQRQNADCNDSINIVLIVSKSSGLKHKIRQVLNSLSIAKEVVIYPIKLN